MGQIPLGWRSEEESMAEENGSRSSVMARLTLSALDRASQDPSCWRDPVVYRALLISGLTVLTDATRHLQQDLQQS